MPELCVLRGLPASGKTTLAQSIISKNPNAVRLNQDDLGKVFRLGNVYSGYKNDSILNIYIALIKQFMKDGRDIVLDDLNFNPNHCQKFLTLAIENNYEFKINTLDVPPCLCIERDKQRENPIGRDAILNLAFKYQLIKQDREFIISDIDGVIADVSVRLDLSTFASGELMLKIFEDPTNIILDEPIKNGIEMIIEASEKLGFEVIFISDRKERTREATESWLVDHNIPYSRLILKEDNDDSTMVDYKSYVLNTYIDKMLCMYALEIDRESSVMYTKENISVINPKGTFYHVS